MHQCQFYGSSPAYRCDQPGTKYVREDGVGHVFELCGEHAEAVMDGEFEMYVETTVDEYEIFRVMKE